MKNKYLTITVFFFFVSKKSITFTESISQ